MRAFRNALMLGAITPLFGACVTASAYRRDVARQEAAAADERRARTAADSLQTLDIAAVAIGLEELGQDFQVLRTELGAQISAFATAVSFDLPVTFAFDDATVRDEDRPVLDHFAHVMATYYVGARLTVEGFADPAGSVAYNRVLSQRRADAVREYLIAHGLSATDITAVGYGKTAARITVPDASGDDAGAEQNRRVTFVLETRSAPTAAPEGEIITRGQAP